MRTIKGKKIGDGYRPYIIAEMACAHDGDVSKAYKLVDMAADAKSDAIQFQLFHTAEIVVPKHHLYSLLEQIEFTSKDWIDLANYARERGLDVWVCTYDVPSVQLATSMNADAIKLNSADLLNLDVLKAVALTGLPFTLGTGASLIDEITESMAFLDTLGAKDNAILMHGVQNFPTQIADLNIARVSLLKKLFNCPVGYHDHTDAELEFSKYVDLIAVGAGANVIEKHITLDRSEKGTDYQAALEPDEFNLFVDTVKTAFVALGNNPLTPLNESDFKYRTFQKKSIVAAVDLKEGETISRDKVSFLRNLTNGLAPNQFSNLEGKKVIKDISAFDNIDWKDVE